MSEHIVVLVTVPDPEKGKEIARTLVEGSLAACCNLVGPITSIYRWKGTVCEEPEHLLVIKTRRGLFEPLASKVREIHPYEVPEVIGLPIEKGLAVYLGWMNDATMPC